MTPRLEAVTLTNFRSVRGTITVPLDAPVVLIHGPNGAGKTSILSGIELALTGDIPELKRAEPDYVTYLVHRGAARAIVEISHRGEDNVHSSGEVHVVQGKLERTVGLSPKAARFFSERCYLAQATLGRLLEIYQYTGSRNSESALTRFVRELLGIDQLDALVEGLHATKDVRNLRRLVVPYRQAEAERDALSEQESKTRSKLSALESEKAAYNERLRERLVRLLPAQSAIPALGDQSRVERLLEGRADEQRQLTLDRLLRKIQALRVEWSGVSSAAGEAERRIVEEAARSAAEQFDAWRSGVGSVLESLIQELRSDFPNLPSSVATDPEFARSETVSAVRTEVERCAALLAQDDADATRLRRIEQDTQTMAGRIATLDQEISKLAGDAEGLGDVLRHLLPHISGDVCPVCDRDFSEVSQEKLSAHLAKKLTRLADRVARLQTASKARAEAINSLPLARREQDALKGRQLRPDARTKLQARRQTLEAVAGRLGNMVAGAKEGSRLAAEAAAKGRELAEFQTRHRRGLAIRESIADLVRQVESPARPDSESPSSTLDHLERDVLREKAFIDERQQIREAAVANWHGLQKTVTAIEEERETLHRVRIPRQGDQ